MTTTLLMVSPLLVSSSSSQQLPPVSPSTITTGVAHCSVQPRVHMLSGFIASGKSTLAGELRRLYGAYVFSADEWLLAEHGADFPVERFNDFGDGIKAVRSSLPSFLPSFLSFVLSVIDPIALDWLV